MPNVPDTLEDLLASHGTSTFKGWPGRGVPTHGDVTTWKGNLHEKSFQEGFEASSVLALLHPFVASGRSSARTARGPAPGPTRVETTSRQHIADFVRTEIGRAYDVRMLRSRVTALERTEQARAEEQASIRSELQQLREQLEAVLSAARSTTGPSTLVVNGGSDESESGVDAEMSPQEARETFDAATLRYLNMSGDEFLRRWDAGEFSHADDRPGLRTVLSLLSLVRPDA